VDIFEGSILEGTKDIPEVFSDVARAAEADRKRMLWFKSGFQNAKSRELPIAEAEALSSDLVTRIIHFYGLLRDALDRHEAKINFRWIKKKTAQRREIILEAWGRDMAPSHRPDWEFTQNGNFGSRGHCTYEDLEAMICPQVNQEDLAKSRRLLSFLNSRGRNHPANFAAADLGAMCIGISLRFLEMGHLPQYVMVVTSHEDIAFYGQLVKANRHKNAGNRPHLLQCLPVGEGLLVLAAQDRILRFLCGCVRHILHDISTEDLTIGPILPSPKLSEKTDTGFASLAVMAAEAPYRLPEQLDFDRIVSLLAAKRSQAADHLRSLREDPGYFHRWAQEASEHRMEMHVDKHGLSNPELRPEHEVEYWTRVMHDAVFTEYMHFEMFTELFTQAEALQQLYRSTAATIQADGDLPEPYMHAILRFRYFLNEALYLMSQRVPVFNSLPWREHYYCILMQEKTPGSGSALIDWKQPCRMSAIQLRLHKHLSRLTDFKKRYTANHESANMITFEIKIFGWATLMDRLHRFIESEPEAMAMITPLVASSIGELSILSECLHQLDIYQPWARTYDTMLTEDRAKLFQSEYYRHVEDTENLMTRSLNLCGESLGRLGAPTHERFSYPIDERMTKENVATLRVSESNLDAFWQRLDTHMTKVFGPVKRTAIQRFLALPFALQRTPALVEPRKATPLGSQPLCTSLAELELERLHATEQTISNERYTAKSKSKAKTKTRRAAVQVESRANVQETSDYHIEGDAPMFAVDARSLKVFKTFFFTPSIGATPGDIKWSDFLHAMASTGFAPEKLYGSVWHFSPTRVELKRSINFHEPHKDGKAADKIPYCIARCIGRRLNRAYGWDGSRFSLAGK